MYQKHLKVTVERIKAKNTNLNVVKQLSHVVKASNHIESSVESFTNVLENINKSFN